jgi:fructose-1,6-bisphosphatase/sedoheptulose 1,7-bisphosphatase-like protein
VGRLSFNDETERQRAISMGMADPDRVLAMSDLVRGEVIFVATGVTGGPMLEGVRRIGDRLHLQSLALRYSTGTVRTVDTSIRADRFG